MVAVANGEQGRADALKLPRVVCRALAPAGDLPPSCPAVVTCPCACGVRNEASNNVSSVHAHVGLSDALTPRRSLFTLLCCRPALLGFALRDSAAAPKDRGGAHEGRHARRWGHANP